jgi:predicted aspartyl protease
MKTARYSGEYSPAAPVLPVNIAVPAEAPAGELMIALVDTGADGTFIPTSILEAMDAPILYMTNVRSHFGESLHRVSIHKVDIILFGSIRLPGIEVVADDWGDQIILGRNVLNTLKLQLDGQEEIISLLE